jgi:hypothetical protein
MDSPRDGYRQPGISSIIGNPCDARLREDSPSISPRTPQAGRRDASHSSQASPQAGHRVTSHGSRGSQVGSQAGSQAGSRHQSSASGFLA